MKAKTRKQPMIICIDSYGPIKSTYSKKHHSSIIWRALRPCWLGLPPETFRERPLRFKLDEGEASGAYHFAKTLSAVHYCHSPNRCEPKKNGDVIMIGT